MKFEAVTIKDIAKALGLSTSTVSRALRDSYEISPETKKLVREYAEKMNYHPNPVALGLKERRTRTIGVIVSEIANHFFSQVINGIESVAYQKGYNVVISQSLESYDREVMNLQYLTSRSIDGIILSVSSETKNFGLLQELSQKGMPLVFFDRIVNEINTHKVIVDNRKGSYEATLHLVANGFKRIAAIAGSPVLSITRERLAGFREALNDSGIPVNEQLISHCMHGGMNYEELEQALERIWNVRPRPDAILATSDKLTLGCLRFLNNKKIKVPETVALIGFSNSEITELLHPPLSVIRQPAFEMGEEAMHLLLQLIESKRPVTQFETRTLHTQLIIRDSCRNVKKNVARISS